MKSKLINFKLLIFTTVIFLGVFGLAKSSQAATCTHYVSPTGNATWANATNINTPTSPATAFANAVADTVVCFRGGTYNVGQDEGDGYNGALNPAHSGTSGHPITFQAYPGETPILNGDASIDGASKGERIIGMGDNSDISWITIDGFVIKASNGGGSVILGSSNTPSGQGYVLKNSEIDGGDAPSLSYDDNYDGVRIGNDSSNVTVTNNKIHGWRRSDWGGSTDNFAAIKIYTCNNCTIQNNEIYDSLSGISQKRYAQGVTIAYNYIHDNKTGILLNINTGYSGNTLDYVIHDNVINSSPNSGSSDYSIGCNTDTGSQLLGGIQVYNNTVRNPYSGCMSFTWLSSGVGETITNDFYNNICVRSSADMFSTVRSSSVHEEDYNEWGTGTFQIRMRVYGSETDYSSLSAWKASTELANSGHPGAGDLTSNPLFTNGSGNYSLLTDFNLQGGSPSKGAGRSGADMGANISLVGVNAGAPADTTPPAAPSGLSVS